MTDKPIFIFTGIASLVCVFLLVSAVPERLAELPPEGHKTFIYGTAAFVVFCLTIAILCFFPQSHWITLRIFGILLMGLCVFTLVDGVRTRNLALLPNALLILPISIYLLKRGQLTE
ncbi:hypothetical protein [Oscillatoria sp. FACHB-1406]|uniref:hypothetical protein n=1 Tax=Oscillatoria sp. FACHB-1406 TaxID=2692846 RepID=UPI001684216B|nr:hypothetical protein [Oscillatoria sp. FACHB-1406]MBD2576471.1 hypothetical protein [Oscillatoria sp. FACHB-1406]